MLFISQKQNQKIKIKLNLIYFAIESNKPKYMYFTIEA